MNTELSRAETLAAMKRFVGLGLDVATVPVLSTSHAGQVWQNKVETDSLADFANVCVRPRPDAMGAFTAFGIRVAPDPYAPTPLEDVPAFQFLNDFDTLRFEAGDAEVVFAFACDAFVTVTEGLEYHDRVFAQPLKGARFVTATGWCGYGMTFDNSGRSVMVSCQGDKLANVRDLPVLIDALKLTGRVQVRADIRVGPISGPPLL
jgi:hypothetical protein